MKLRYDETTHCFGTLTWLAYDQCRAMLVQIMTTYAGLLDSYTYSRAFYPRVTSATRAIQKKVLELKRALESNHLVNPHFNHKLIQISEKEGNCLVDRALGIDMDFLGFRSRPFSEKVATLGR